MAKVIRIGKAENPAEIRTFQYLETNLPDTYLVLANASIQDLKSRVEVDAIVLGTSGIYTLEIKDWKGKIAGTEQGDWSVGGSFLRNPCDQVKLNSQVLRSFVGHNAKKIFRDPRVATSIRFNCLIVFADPEVDIAKAQANPFKWFLGCVRLDKLAPTILHQHERTQHFLTHDEIRSVAEELGALKGELGTWQADKEVMPAICPHCKRENRADAKFCGGCGKELG